MLRLLVVSCVVMIAIAFAINAAVGPKPLVRIALEGPPFATQIALGSAIGGSLSALACAAVLSLPVFAGLRRFLVDFASTINLDGLNPIWVSLLAGTGEEILFRGALQPVLGLWWTSLIFALAHMRPDQFRSSPSSALLFLGSVCVAGFVPGILFLQIGLIAAIAMHIAWDIVATVSLRSAVRRDRR